MKRAIWTFALPLALISGISGATAQRCYLEECGSGYWECYRLAGAQWCEQGSDGSYSVNCYNHTRWGSPVSDSWYLWAYPPTGSSNSVYLYTDGINNANHDIDYWEYNRPGDIFWGYTEYNTSGGCIVRGSGAIYGNVSTIPNNYTSQLRLFEHETGHAIGLAHVCACPPIMDPCLNCGHQLSDCDAAAAAALYPPLILSRDGDYGDHSRDAAPRDGWVLFVDWIQHENLADLAAHTDLVVRGWVSGQRTEIVRSYEYDPVLQRPQTAGEAGDSYGRTPFTLSTLTVDTLQLSFAGSRGIDRQPVLPGSQIDIRQIGGMLDGKPMVAEGDRLLQEGEEVILFLHRLEEDTASGQYEILGGVQGRFHIENGGILAGGSGSDFARFNGMTPAQFLHAVQDCLKQR